MDLHRVTVVGMLVVVVLAVEVVTSTANVVGPVAPLATEQDTAVHRDGSFDVAAGVVVGYDRFTRTQAPAAPALPVAVADEPALSVAAAGGAHIPIVVPSTLTTVWFVPMAALVCHLPSDTWNDGIALSAYAHLTFSAGGVALAGYPWGVEGGLGVHARYDSGSGPRLLTPSILFDVVYAPKCRYVLRVLYDIGGTTIAETATYRQTYATWSIQFVYWTIGDDGGRNHRAGDPCRGGIIAQ